MMIEIRLFLLAALCSGVVSCASTSKPREKGVSSRDAAGVLHQVKTTAYTQTESDHIAYGAKSAVGTTLRFGHVRSAAADWSVYPVGTQFKINGEPYVYEVDDYGSALVGTKTIDLYRPSKAAMNEWGARKVDIQVLKWGSYDDSLTIMKPREKVKPHIKRMVTAIEAMKPSAS